MTQHLLTPHPSRSQAAPLLRAAMLTAVLLLCACKSEVDLHTGLGDSEANQVVAALRADGMKATKRAGKNGVTVSVTEADLARATQVLSAQGLPHQPGARMGQVFKKEGLISSPLEERARYIYALSQELESTLAQIDGVIVARVHVVLPEKVAPGEPLQPPSAAVFIKHLATLEPDAISHRVKQLVARAVPGMGHQALDRVSTVFVLADTVPQRAPEPPDRTPWFIAFGVLLAALALGAAGRALQRAGWRPQMLKAAPPAAPAAKPSSPGQRPPAVSA